MLLRQSNFIVIIDLSIDNIDFNFQHILGRDEKQMKIISFFFYVTHIEIERESKRSDASFHI